MNEVIIPQQTRVSPAPTVAWTPLGENAILIMSACDAIPGKVPVAVDGNPRNKVQTMALTWRRPQADASQAVGFLCLAPAPSPDRAGGGAILLGRPGRPLRLILAAKPLPLQAFLAALADEAGQSFPTVVDGLLEVLLAGKSNPRRLRAVGMLLQSVAKPGGFIEVMGPQDDGVFVQGWTSNFTAGRTQLLIAHGGLSPAVLEAGIFERDDLGEGARGFFGLLEECEIRHPSEIERLFFRGNDGWRALEVYERHVLLEPVTVPGHLRDGLQRGSAPPATSEKLKRASQRFDGRDTVCLLEQPVRAGIDDATIVEGTGVLIIGWLFDPERKVAAATLRSGSQSCPLDKSWTRVSRPDVAAAFLEDPRFGPALAGSRNSHGFIVFAPKLDPEPGQPLYIEFEIEGQGPAFLPLTPGRAPARRALERVFGLLDPRSSTATSVVEKQIAPALQAAEIAPPRAVESHDIGSFNADAALGLVIGLDHRQRELSSLFALLAIDPEVRRLPIVVAAPGESFDRLGAEARRLARFYGLSIRLVLVEGVEDSCDALEAGLRACRFQTAALLSGAAQIRMPGWLGRLERAYRGRGGQCVASPTLLFEDNSIRWAGAWLEGEGTERRVYNRFVGYPLEAIGSLGPMEVAAGATECCVLSRAAFIEAGGFSRNYFTTGEKGLDLCLKLRMHGAPSLWVPEVEIYVVEDGEAARPPTGVLASLADRASFDRRWALAISNMRG
ncbi:glycosyltransferase family 2 protein [Bosea sp. (in: a-proteobacteria)]|uniref:glycosyltransferase family 2 protein n=1 Tax=Bosea sp. (in: a-proteobacteria) TaxID=1871050 RepID=UPI002FC7091C